MIQQLFKKISLCRVLSTDPRSIRFDLNTTVNILVTDDSDESKSSGKLNETSLLLRELL